MLILLLIFEQQPGAGTQFITLSFLSHSVTKAFTEPVRF
jgi:hypothetical protein